MTRRRSTQLQLELHKIVVTPLKKDGSPDRRRRVLIIEREGEVITMQKTKTKKAAKKKAPAVRAPKVPRVLFEQVGPRDWAWELVGSTGRNVIGRGGYNSEALARQGARRAQDAFARAVIS